MNKFESREEEVEEVLPLFTGWSLLDLNFFVFSRFLSVTISLDRRTFCNKARERERSAEREN